MEDSSIQRVKILKIIGLCFGILCFILILYVIVINILHSGKTKVSIKIAPYDSAVFLDEKEISNNAESYITPGVYKITAYHNGFFMYIEDVEISGDTQTITQNLSSNSELGNQIISDNSNQFKNVEIESSKNLKNKGNQERNNWSILKYLPSTNVNFGIGYMFENGENQAPTLTITTKPIYIDTAVNKLRNFDSSISLSDYNFRINDFINPLDGNFINNSADNSIDFIRNGYSNIQYNIDIDQGDFKDDFFYTTIVLDIGSTKGDGNPDANYIPLTMRVVLKKQGPSWSLCGTPYPLLNIYNTPNVPNDILDSVNRKNSSA